MNVLKTGLLLAALTAVLVLVGDALGGSQGATTALVLSLAMNVATYWFSDRIVLAMYRAKPLAESDAPQVYRAVREIATRERMPMPKLYGIPTATPNAFATGRSPHHASVAVTAGLLELMNEEELKGVIAHELSHVKNRDTLTMTVAAALVGAITWVVRWAYWVGPSRDRDERQGGGVQAVLMLLAIVLAPLAAALIQLAISRTREYSADATGARLTGNPYGLADALEKLNRAVRANPLPNANPATAHLFIVNPLRPGEMLANLFSTHPPIEERVRRLRAMRL